MSYLRWAINYGLLTITEPSGPVSIKVNTGRKFERPSVVPWIIFLCASQSIPKFGDHTAVPNICSSCPSDVNLFAPALAEHEQAARRRTGQQLRGAAKPKMKVGNWIKKLGFWGFMFFLVKGLLWLTIPALLAILANR